MYDQKQMQALTARVRALVQENHMCEAEAAAAKMVRRHPHVFHEPMLDDAGKPLTGWKEIKAQEKKGREWGGLPAACV